jgi:HlyD family secretion protein
MPRHPPRSGKRKQAIGGSKKIQNVWTLVNNQPVALPVTIGLTDGFSTQIIDGDVQPGMELIINAESVKK